MKDVVVVGAGIGGLTAAYYLKKEGLEPVVLETTAVPGGVVQSGLQDEFLLEWGANSSLSKPHLAQLIQDLDFTGEIVYPLEKAKRRYFAQKDKDHFSLEPLPKTLGEAVHTPLLSWKGKVRTMVEPFISACEDEDESVHSFISRRLGGEVADRIVATILSGIWAADIEKLSCRSALPFCWKLEKEHRSLARGTIRRYLDKDASEKRDKTKMLSFRRGMASLIEAIADSFPEDTIRYRKTVQRIELLHEGVRVHYSPLLRDTNTSEKSDSEYVDAKSVILATPADVTSGLLREYDESLSDNIGRIPYAPIGILHLAFPADTVRHEMDGFGFLVPPEYNSPLLGAIFNSSVFPDRAPDGQHLVTCFVGGSRHPSSSDVTFPQVQKEVIKFTRELIQADSDPKILSARAIRQAIPNYPVGHFRLQEQVHAFHRQHRNVYILGNWHRGISFADRVERAMEISEDIASNSRELLHQRVVGSDAW